MTIYEELVQRVYDGETFYINFKNRSMKIGKKFVIADGIYDSERQLIECDYSDTAAILSRIESLYSGYKYSLPSERSDSKRRKYFKALSMEELTDKQLMIAQRREVAQARLEGFILCMVLNGKFKWTTEMGKWFWESKNDPDLVILKNFIEN
jgi:hypothetical protein